MAILIKGMKMPQTCFKCKFSSMTPSWYAYCRLTEKCYPADDPPPSDCPLGEVPEPHGRLIDANALLDDVRRHSESYFADDFARDWVDNAPTIIPASGEEV